MAMAMATAQPLWNQKKKLLLLFEPALHLRDSRLTPSINPNTNSTDPEGGETHGNGNDNSKCGGIDIRENVRRLCKQGRLKEALEIFHVMDRRGIPPDSSTYGSLLQECVHKKALLEGRLIHAHMIETGFEPDIFLGTKLVIMYAKCKSLADARRFLDEMPKRNVVSWTALIAAYARDGHNEEALALYSQMQREGIEPNKFTFAGVLPACANLAALKRGKELHEDITRSGFQSDTFVGSALVDMYAKCGSIEDARNVFDEMPERDVVSWNSVITGYAQNGHVDEAMKLFQKMPERNVISWNAMIAGYLQNGQGVAAFRLFQKMPEQNEVSWNTMIAGYAQNGDVDEALKLFQKLPEGSVVSWTAIIAGYAQNGNFIEALKVFKQMQLTAVKPDSFTFTSVLTACANLAALKNGKEVHGNIIRSRFPLNISVGNTLVDTYAKCGSVENARKVFDKMAERNAVSWNVLIAGYAHDGDFDEALKLFQRMPERDAVSWNAMIQGYTQNGYVDEAVKLFQKIPEQNSVSWSLVIAGYAKTGYFDEALKIFRQMQLTGVKPDAVTFTSVLSACANSAALKNGKEVHENTIRTGFQFHISVGSALVDMYAKCGTIEDACKVFDRMLERDMVSWNAMIGGYAKHGCGKEALQLLKQMKHSGMKPDRVTFIGVLSACSHAGLVDDGWQYFNSMSQDYHIKPAVEHYCCMVDLLGRAGRLDEAHDFINEMPIKPNAAVWGSLLGACRIHSNIELGECVAKHLFELDPKNAARYVLLSNIYAAAGRWDDAKKVRRMMKDKSLKKIPGSSWIEVNNKVYSFVVRDRSHPQMHKVYAELDRLSQKIKEAGYIPETNLVLHDVEEEQKEHILCYHSEKLAIAFGLIYASPGTPIRIFKNLRVCGDCHSATKFISKIVKREIVVRDANRFHHIKDGWCSCGDYW